MAFTIWFNGHVFIVPGLDPEDAGFAPLAESALSSGGYWVFHLNTSFATCVASTKQKRGWIIAS
jgi:hypothetical protein